MAAVDVVTAVAAVDDVRQRLPGPDVDLFGTTSPRPEVVDDVPRKATPDARNIRDKYRLSDFDMRTTVGTGTFGRVVLVRHRQSRHFYALKILPIADVLRLKQAQHVRNEKEILVSTRHPFIVDLLWTNHTKQYLFMLFEFIGGGELFTYLRNAGRFENHAAVFYASEIVLIFEYLHSKSIIYRDLKPENLLLDRHGHIRLCDFGFAKMVEDRTWTLCGTPEYLAPEIILSKGYNKTVDWWALGVFIYEMLVGYPPFFDERPFGIYEKILGGQVNFPKDVEPSARDLIKRLLAQDRTKRLGTQKNGAEDVKHHRWFDLVNWDDVYAKKVKPPIVPEVLSEGDTHNFENYPNFEWTSETIISPEDLALFDDF